MSVDAIGTVVKVLDEAAMIAAAACGNVDPVRVLTAFDQMGGPYGGQIEFVETEDGGIWACHLDPVSFSVSRLIAAIFK